MVPAKLEGKWKTREGTESKSIIVVSDHGTGSTTYVDMLTKNPCVIKGNEPFGGVTLWASDQGVHSYFDGTGKRNHGVESNPKLAKALVESAKNKGWDIRHMDHHIKLIARAHVHKVGDITEYFRHITQYACAAMPQDVKDQCSNKCAVVYKMFPRYVGGHSEIAEGGSRYYLGNKNALEFWGHTLHQMKSSPHFAMALVERDEQDRELSNFRRFAGVGSFFDCSLKKSSPFFTQARQELSGHPTVEPVHCLSSLHSTTTCLGKVLRETGLHIDKEAIAEALEGAAKLGASQHSTGHMKTAGCEHGIYLVKKPSGVQAVKKHKDKDELTDVLRQASRHDAMQDVAAMSNNGQLVDAEDGWEWW